MPYFALIIMFYHVNIACYQYLSCHVILGYDLKIYHFRDNYA